MTCILECTNPQLSCHSIKTGEVNVLIQAAAESKIEKRIVLLMGKHVGDLYDFPEDTSSTCFAQAHSYRCAPTTPLALHMAIYRCGK